MNLLDHLGWHQLEQFSGLECTETRMPIDDLIEGLEIAKENIRETFCARRERRPRNYIYSVSELMAIHRPKRIRFKDSNGKPGKCDQAAL